MFTTDDSNGRSELGERRKCPFAADVVEGGDVRRRRMMRDDLSNQFGG
jgi:hypothetical protein